MIGTGRAGVAVVCALAVALAGGSLWAAMPEAGIALQRPGDAGQVRIEPGAPALHVVFFATWCPPCVNELRRLGELDARWNERGYRLVVIAVQNRHTADRLARFISENEVPGELLFDADGSAQAALGAQRLPTHLVFAASGEEVLRAGGVDEGVGEVVQQLLGADRRPRGGAP